MIKYSLLKDSLATAVKFLSKTNELGKNFVIKSDGDTLELSACDGSYAYFCCLANSGGAVLDVSVRGDALIALLGAFDPEDEIDFDVHRQNLILSNDVAGKFQIPFTPSENSWKVPAPEGWFRMPEEIKETLLAMRRSPVRRKSETLPTTFCLRDNSILCVSPFFLYHEPFEHGLDITLLYEDLPKLMPGFDAISIRDRNVYFGDASEWCMLPEYTKKTPDCRQIVKDVQKTNICVININVSDLTNLLTRFKAVAKAEDLLSSELLTGSPAGRIALRFTPTTMLVSSTLGEIEIPIFTISEFEELAVKTSIDFLLTMTRELLARNSDVVSLRLGFSMKMVNAACDSRQIFGTIYN